jgi:hypothetical protein
MFLFAIFVMVAWIPAVLWLFSRIPTQRAMIISFVVAWLFLPQVSFVFPGIPDYTKMTATCYGIMLATTVYDVQRFKSFRLSWVDFPIMLHCISPFFSSMANGLGPYDGLSNILEQLVTWGLPYFLGRLYLNSLSALRDLALVIIGGGFAYIPFCLLESRMSPQLHNWVYGFHAHDINQTFRLGGYRPTVFMQHGLMVGIWMMTATILVVWLWRTNVLPKVNRFQWRGKLYKLQTRWLAVIMLVTFILLRSTGAYFLLALALLILFVARRHRTLFPLVIMLVLMNGYLFMSAGGYLTGSQRVQMVGALTRVVGAERADSLAFRLQNEELLGDRARQAMVFGWGGWNRSRVFDEYGKDKTITDSLWIIAFGERGLFGLTSLMVTLLLPVVVFCTRFRPSSWGLVQVAPAAGLTVALAMYALDCVMNAMVNPIFIVLGGGINGLIFFQGIHLQQKVIKTKVIRHLKKPRNFLT